MNERFPAIVAVGYNRPDCMERLIKSVENADYPEENITLIISIDCSEKSDEVEKAAREVGWSHGELIIQHDWQREKLRCSP